MPGAEPFLAGAETPSLIGATLRVGLAIVVLAAAATAWFYWNRKVKGPNRHLEVLDRAFLARGASVTLVRVDDRRLLVGVSPEGVRLIARLDDGPMADIAVESDAGFAAVLGRETARREAREC